MIGRSGLPRHALLWCLALSMPNQSVAADDEWRWRHVKGDDSSLLARLDTDGGTDNLGGLVFRCEHRSGSVQVSYAMSDAARRAFAGIIERDDYPSAKLVPGTDADIVYPRPLHSDLDGWMLEFEMSPNALAFESFKQSGTFQFEVASVLVREGLDRGLEAIPSFQQVCRKSN
jgi:hypothetical protein